MENSIKVYTKPLRAMSIEELTAFWGIVGLQLERGGVVQLGGEGCAFCGERLGKQASGYTKVGKGELRLIIHACSKCREEMLEAINKYGYGPITSVGRR